MREPAGLGVNLLAGLLLLCSCGGSKLQPSLVNPPLDNDRQAPPSATSAPGDDCSSSVPGATVDVRKVDGGARVVDVRLGPQELSGSGCRGRERLTGTATGD
jgi:hypothetical protein